jgi:hypothetical protein
MTSIMLCLPDVLKLEVAKHFSQFTVNVLFDDGTKHYSIRNYNEHVLVYSDVVILNNYRCDEECACKNPSFNTVWNFGGVQMDTFFGEHTHQHDLGEMEYKILVNDNTNSYSVGFTINHNYHNENENENVGTSYSDNSQLFKVSYRDDDLLYHFRNNTWELSSDNGSIFVNDDDLVDILKKFGIENSREVIIRYKNAKKLPRHVF